MIESGRPWSGSVLPAGAVADPVGRLQEALAARSVITQAEGVLMGRYRVSAAAAHLMLRDIGRRSGCPLRQVASDVLRSTQAPRHSPRQAVAIPAADPSDGDARLVGPARSAAERPSPVPTSPMQSSPLRLDVSPRQPDGTIYVRVDGDWAQSSAAEISRAFDVVARHRPRLVIVDLADVGILDLTALGALLEMRRNHPAVACPVELHNTPAHLNRLLRGLAGPIPGGPSCSA